MCHLFRYRRPVDNGPGPDYPGRVGVGVCGMSALPALKLALGLAIGFLAMSALSTGPTGVSGINSYDGDPGKLALVLDERAELEKRPTPLSGPLSPAKPFPSLSDALQVFQGDPAIRAFGLGNEPFADDVVGVSPELRFSLTHSLLRPPNGFWAFPGFLPTCRCLVQSPTAFGIADTHCVDLVVGMNLSIGVGGDLANAQIDPDEVRGRDGRSVGRFNGDEQKPLPVLTKHQVRLALGPAESFALVLAHDERDDDTSFQGRNAYSVRPLERDIPAHAERHGGVLFESRLLRLVPFVGFDHLGDDADGGFGWKTESLSDLVVDDLVQGEFVGQSSLEGDVGDPGCCFVESLYRLNQASNLPDIGQKLELERQFHLVDYIGCDGQYQAERSAASSAG